MEILVIGGSGFIGTRLVDELLDEGYKVSIFDINVSKKYPDITIQGDVTSLQELIAAAKGKYAIYNLAAEHRDDVTPITLYHDVNVKGAANTVTAAIENDIKKIIFTSTVAIYGLNKKSPDESFPAEPFNEYGRSKLQAEEIFKKWYDDNTDNCLTIIRPAVVFGEGNRGNVYNLISQIYSGRFIMIGKGQNKKSMGYVGNIADFLSKQIDNTDYSVYNFCDKPDLTSVEIANTIATALNKSLPRFHLPLYIGLIAGGLFDLAAKLTGKKMSISSIRIKKFAAETTISNHKLIESGYNQKYTLQESLTRMVNHDFLRKDNN